MDKQLTCGNNRGNLHSMWRTWHQYTAVPVVPRKRLELILGWRQIVLGLVVDTNRLTVRICNNYLKQVRKLLKCKWHSNRKFLWVSKLQKAHRQNRTNWWGCPMDLQADVTLVHLLGLFPKKQWGILERKLQWVYMAYQPNQKKAIYCEQWNPTKRGVLCNEKGS